MKQVIALWDFLGKLLAASVDYTTWLKKDLYAKLQSPTVSC